MGQINDNMFDSVDMNVVLGASIVDVVHNFIQHAGYNILGMIDKLIKGEPLDS